MDWSYGFDSKASNKKVTAEEYHDFDEKGKPNEDGYGYPYEDGGVMSKPRAVVVDGGQRKSSFTHYPNVDGSDSYVVRTERVVKVVRPVMTTHYSLKEDRDDNLGMAKSFLDQFLKEAAMSSAPVHQSRTYWGCRDDSPLKYDEYSHQFSPPNMAKFPSWEETNDEHQELGRPRTGSRRNWSSRDESPPRFVTHPEWNHPNHSGGRHNWPSHDQDDYPPRSMMHSELSHINSSSARPNWPSRDNSFPRPLVHHQLSQSNPGSTPYWARQYDSPPRSVEYLEVGHSNSSAKPNWPSRYNSPPRLTRRFVSNHPNSSARSNWQAREDSPPESSYYPNSSTRPNWPSQYHDSPPKSMYLESSHPNSGIRPNWSSRDDSPPRPTEYTSLTTHNAASTKPNWSSRVESPPRSMTHLTLNHPNSPSTKPSWRSHQEAGSPSPDNIENGRDNINTGLVLKKFDELNLQDSRGTSPLPNQRSGSDASNTANYNSTSMDSGQRPNWPNRKGHSTYKTNKDDHEKPKFNGAQTKNTHDEEIPDIINNKKIANSYKTPKYSDWPIEDEDEDEDDDSKKSGMLRSNTNVSHKASETKPNYSSGSYNQPVSSTTTNDEVSDIMKLVEEAKKTATYDPNEITLNPPQQMHYWGYYKPVLDSNEASRKYNGIYRRT